LVRVNSGIGEVKKGDIGHLTLGPRGGIEGLRPVGVGLFFKIIVGNSKGPCGQLRKKLTVKRVWERQNGTKLCQWIGEGRAQPGISQN